MSLGLHRPRHEYPHVDLANIYFSCPNEAQLKTAKEEHDRSVFTKEGQNYTNIRRRVSMKQAEYITHLISEMLTEKFKDGIPPDSEIEDIIKEIRTRNYAANVENEKRLKKFLLSEKENQQLARIRQLCVEKGLTFSLEFDPEPKQNGELYLIAKICNGSDAIAETTLDRNVEEGFSEILKWLSVAEYPYTEFSSVSVYNSDGGI
ncbi:hypothetical protein [Flavobacterium sp.]|uniref:hypothetical protein n=1 Tax=Flavobacterium sp. TaxID=239 RepID=UPI0037C0DAAA